jgi:hydroxymethylglutaryl-CoA reductase (NADPH)
MSTDPKTAARHLREILGAGGIAGATERLAPHSTPLTARVPHPTKFDETAIRKRWQMLPAAATAAAELLDPDTLRRAEVYAHHIENFIGTVKVPVGIAGPLRVNGLYAQGDYFVPLATTEAALVASYTRGATLITLAGGCASCILNEGVGRAPAFAFRNIPEAGIFVHWCLENQEQIRAVAESTTQHGKLVDLRVTLEANHVYLLLQFTTGDAAGQNMVTIATQAACNFIAANCPAKPEYWFVESNMSGDKKASSQSFQSVRGRKVTAEVRLPGELVAKHLHTTPRRMADYWRMSAVGGVLSGTIGIQGHYANGLAALFIACGQDAACVAESAVGLTRFELTEDGGLYASVTLPNLIIGTVGGGTGLPSARACLDLLGLAGPGHARALAELCAALALAGELSIIGALSANEFTRAHQRLARSPAATPPP